MGRRLRFPRRFGDRGRIGCWGKRSARPQLRPVHRDGRCRWFRQTCCGDGCRFATNNLRWRPHFHFRGRLSHGRRLDGRPRRSARMRCRQILDGRRGIIGLRRLCHDNFVSGFCGCHGRHERGNRFTCHGRFFSRRQRWGRTKPCLFRFCLLVCLRQFRSWRQCG